MFHIEAPYFISHEKQEKNIEKYKNHSEKFEEIIVNILQENNQVRKKIPDGDIQIFKALSYALFYTTSYDTCIQNICNKYLLSLIRTNSLTEKLSIFKNNMLSTRDFINNPTQNSGFERV